MHSRPYTLGSFAAGCAGLMALGAVMLTGPGCTSSPPPPPPPTQAVVNTPSPTSTPTVATSTGSPTPVDMAASRPKETPDPFDKNHGGGVALANNVPAPAKTKAPAKGPKVAVAPTAPTSPTAPPANPGYTAVGIFASSSGPEAIIATKDGTQIVHQGAKLPDGGVVKSIDVNARKVVIDKENYDFVLPLEAPAPSSGPGALPPPPAPSGK